MAFNHLLKFNRAEAEYQVWVDNAPTHSPAYHQLVGVNLDDPDQIFPALRFSKATADYFLSHIGFPTEMKEFPDKLSASGWDTGEIKSCPTVGFRGTNDSRQTLPLSVGNGQSVVFFIPNEVKFNILALRRKDGGSPIDVSDVLLQAVAETSSEIRRSIPLWAVQGLDVLSSALQEEQERELPQEIGIEPQVHRPPPPATPAAHPVYPHITSFVATGR
ncbi:hypothetical protein E8E15_001169 [Penicillium rubens]|nr:hypothetical protein E8E15_001169 [Penicillium rubens]